MTGNHAYILNVNKGDFIFVLKNCTIKYEILPSDDPSTSRILFYLVYTRYMQRMSEREFIEFAYCFDQTGKPYVEDSFLSFNNRFVIIRQVFKRDYTDKYFGGLIPIPSTSRSKDAQEILGRLEDSPYWEKITF